MAEANITMQQKKNRYTKWCTTALGTDKSASCPVSCEAAYTFKAYPYGKLEDVTCSYINEDNVAAYQYTNRINNFCSSGKPTAEKCACSCAAARKRLQSIS